MNNAMSLEDLRDKLSLLLATQSPHLPTNATDITLSDGYRTVELRGIANEEEADNADDLRSELKDAEDEIEDLKDEMRDDHREMNRLIKENSSLFDQRDSARSEVLKLQQDIIDLGLQLNSVLSR